MNSRSVFLGAAIGLAALLTLAGCGSSGSGASSNNEPAPAAGSGSAKIDINPKTGKQIVMGFAQVGAESGWRTANTQSIKDEAAKRGIDLKFSDAQGKQENEIKAIRGFIAQGVDIIAFSPIVETGWGPVLSGSPTIPVARRRSRRSRERPAARPPTTAQRVSATFSRNTPACKSRPARPATSNGIMASR